MNRLYLVTDSDLCRQAGYELPYLVEEACRAGIRWVQLRDKRLTTKAFIDIGVVLKQITQAYGANLLINDRIDIAMAIDADGVHIGQDDMPYPMVRSLLGYNKIIGLSVNTIGELQASHQWDVDYVGVATIFPTGTKSDTSSLLGLSGLRAICAQANCPTVAIGGIKAHTIRDVLAAGATSAAVVSAICGQASPFDATQELIQLTDQYI